MDQAYPRRPSLELFCLASGMEALGEMMDHDAQAICGPRHARGRDRQAHRWGKTKGRIGFHGGKVEIERPRLRGFDGKEQPIPSWEAAVAEDWLGKWAMNQMLINVSTRERARRPAHRHRDETRPVRRVRLSRVSRRSGDLF
jgi:putative transposase